MVNPYLPAILETTLGGAPQDDPYSAWPGLQMFPPQRPQRSLYDNFEFALPWPRPTNEDKWSIFDPFTPEE